MNLLLYFALPIATIILAIVWQRIIKSPLLVAATAFAIYLIVTYAAFDSSFLIFTLVYTILAFLAAALAKFFTDNMCKNGVFKNITANNINTNTLSTNILNTDNDPGNGNGCGCNRCYRTGPYRYR